MTLPPRPGSMRTRNSRCVFIHRSPRICFRARAGGVPAFSCELHGRGGHAEDDKISLSPHFRSGSPTLTSQPTRPITYADSGVDIARANKPKQRIKYLAQKTFNRGVLSEIGGFGGRVAAHPHS